MKLILVFFLIGIMNATGCAQSHQKPKTAHVGGSCEGCEAIYSSPIPFNNLNWIDTLPDFNEPGPKLAISGTIFKADGKTPASNVVLYIYHTDQNGRYTNKYNEKGYAGRNGYIKGWIRTNEKGQYAFYTLKPASYPNSSIPAHIHPVIKEEDKNEYWIDEYLFQDDPFLTPSERAKQPGRGGNGIITLEKRDNMWYGVRNIYLGRKVPGYE